MKWRSKYYNSKFAWSATYAVLMLFSSCSEVRPGAEVPDIDTSILNVLVQSPAHTVLSNQKTVRFGEIDQGITTTLHGFIAPDERRTNRIASRVNGRIEKLYVRFPYQFVKKGQKLYDIYSPELSTAISEYFFLLSKDSASVLAGESRKKLLQYGLSESQLKTLVQTRKVPDVITIYSAFEGYVLPEVNNSPASGFTSAEMPSMSGMSSSVFTGNDNIKSAALLREGSYITAGQTIFSLNDAGGVIAIINIPNPGETEIKIGEKIVLHSDLLPGKDIAGTVNLLEPTLQPNQKFVTMRVELPNAGGELKYNSLVTAELSSDSIGKNSLPASCVFDLGTRKIVWVKSGDADGSPVFIPRVISAGRQEKGFMEILAGIEPGEEVAIEAGLLTDRESIIQTELR